MDVSPPSLPSSSFPAATESARILLVEDDVLVSEACAMLLEEFGYSVRCAGSAEEALAAGVRVGTACETTLTLFSAGGEFCGR